jgi:hypothetical protein
MNKSGIPKLLSHKFVARQPLYWPLNAVYKADLFSLGTEAES